MGVKESLLATRANLPTATVQVDGVGAVSLRGMTAGECDRWRSWCRENSDKPNGRENYRASLVAKCLVDEGGARMFNDLELSDISAMPSAVVEALYDAAADLCGFGVKQADKLEKNSESRQ